VANENIVTPHFQLPFQFTEDGNALEIEQGSDNEIQQSAYAILSYQPGQLVHDPTFGIPDPTLQKGGVNLTAVASALSSFDNRIDDILESDPSWVVTLIEVVNVRRNLQTNA
jgi:hypothetical protein